MADLVDVIEVAYFVPSFTENRENEKRPTNSWH
jgi:hypothetical protein